MPAALADVLLVTVTKVESKAVVDLFQEASNQKPRPVSIERRTYFDLGRVNGARMYLTLSEMGAGGLDAALLTVQKGIDALQPRAVIMIGIAFGASDQWQKMGDILVSENLRCYELARVGTENGSLKGIPRGDRPHSSAWLLNLLRSADITWTGASVHFGVVLTGEKLVDNIDYREQLHAFEPEAIGGEMEGAGLYAACHDRKVDWILVKAICDWADGKKEQDRQARQQTAALNAAKFVLHALQFAPFEHGGSDEPAAPAEEAQSSLPIQPFFFGREKELAGIAEAISREARTWGVLIDGPGGIGKTSLAVRAGHLAPAADFPRKIFVSAKVRELTPSGEQKIQDFTLPKYLELLSELARELGDEEIAKSPEAGRADAVRRALTGRRVLLVIDNIETFPEDERVRLYQFLNRLPPGSKAIVTSRRRSDVDARVIRLERMEHKDAMSLMAELAKTNKRLAAATESDWQTLYEMTNGNPLLLRWTVGQLGRADSECRTVAEACVYLEKAPAGNDPLEYIFGDLLDTFTPSETAVLAALTHFTLPAQVKWIADLASLAARQAQTALEDLADRALLVGDPAAQAFYLPPLTAEFLRRKRPEAVIRAADRLADRAYALVLENGGQNYERFQVLEEEWPTVAAALPRFVLGDNDRLQKVCTALEDFLNFSGRWDQRMSLDLAAEDKAVAAGNYSTAGWRAYQAGWVAYLRGLPAGVLDAAARAEAHWQKAGAGPRERSTAIRLRGIGLQLQRDYPAASKAYQESLDLLRTITPESEDTAGALNDLADVERLGGDPVAAERDWTEALRIAKNIGYREGVATYAGNLTLLALDRSDWPAAEQLARQALALSENLGRQELIGLDYSRLAKALAHQGRAAEGLPHAERAVRIFKDLGKPGSLAYAQGVLDECKAATS